MPVIKRKVTAASANVVNGLRFSKQKRPFAASLWASTPTAGEALTFGVDDLIITEDAPMNLEIANEVVDTARDQILFREPCPSGEIVLGIPTVAADCSYLLNIEQL